MRSTALPDQGSFRGGRRGEGRCCCRFALPFFPTCPLLFRGVHEGPQASGWDAACLDAANSMVLPRERPNVLLLSSHGEAGLGKQRQADTAFLSLQSLLRVLSK